MSKTSAFHWIEIRKVTICKRNGEKGGNLGQFNQLNERLSWLTEELQLYLCLLLRRLK